MKNHFSQPHLVSHPDLVKKIAHTVDANYSDTFG